MKTIHEAAAALRAGRTTPVELVKQCLANIDRCEEKVKAWVFIDRAGALAEAHARADEIKRFQVRGPLHGIPIAIKDIFDVFDWPTAAGSKLWSQSIARQDCEVVRRLREAGAIFLGKTVTTAYASFDPPVTRNPWNLSHTPGGSSSGSAAALAVGMCLGAIGSQTGGSINRPASYCGVQGLKPTYGLVSCDGVVPLAPSMDHPGPMGRSVRDLAIMLQVMAGFDGSTIQKPVPDYTALLSEDAAPPCLGRVRGLFEDLAEPAMQGMMVDVCAILTSGGLRPPLAEVALPSGFGTVIADHRVIMAVEAAAYHRLRVQRHPEDFPPRIRSLIDEGLACPAWEYERCLKQQQRLRQQMVQCLEHFDALIMPATTSPAPPAETTGNPAFNSPWSFTGLPSLSLPTGHFADGLPLCVQLVGGWGREASLLKAALWCEKALGVQPLDAIVA